MADAQIAAADRVTQQAEEVIALGLRLLQGAGSLSRYPGDPNDPMTLVNRLEANAVGCAWLLDRWDELRTTLEGGGTWQLDDRIRAVRLLGHRPIDLVDDDRVLSVYVCCIAIDPVGPTELVAIADGMDATSKSQFLARVDQRRRSIPYPEDAGAARASLLELIAVEERRLEELLEAHLAREEASLAGSVIDSSLAGERVRRYQIACDRALLRVLNVLEKRRRQAEAAGDPQGPVATAEGANLPVVERDAPLRPRSTPRGSRRTNPTPRTRRGRNTASAMSTALNVPLPDHGDRAPARCGQGPGRRRPFVRDPRDECRRSGSGMARSAAIVHNRAAWGHGLERVTYWIAGARDQPDAPARVPGR